MRPEAVLIASAGGFLRSYGGATCPALRPASRFASSCFWQPASTTSAIARLRRIGLAREVAVATRGHRHVVLDPDPAERRELADELPVDEALAVAAAELLEQTLDEVQTRLDREHLADLDRRRVAQELVLGPRRPQLHA